MWLRSLTARQFRNYESLSVTFSPTLNIIHGFNAQGKSNLIEGIAYLANLTSFRGHNDAVLIRESAPFFALEGTLENGPLAKPLKVTYQNGQKKKFVNQQEVRKTSDYLGQFHVVVFQPSDVLLCQEEPRNRRLFLDQELGSISPSYDFLIKKYHHLLKQRNEWYKQPIDETYFQVITKQLIEVGLEVTQKRRQFLAQIKEPLEQIYRQLYDETVTLKIDYQSTYGDDAISVEQVQQLLNEKQAAERVLQTTLVGPHRDDFTFVLNGRPIADYGSQGQQRLAVVSLKLALLEVIYTQTGERAVVCLDDVLSELDPIRQERVLTTLSREYQVFITTTHLEEINSQWVQQAKCYRVQQGTVVLEEDVYGR